MSDFYTVLRRSLDRADAPDEEQRQEIYDRLRAVIVRKLDAHRPRLKDTEFRQRLVAFDDAVGRIEDEIAASFAAADDVFDELPYEDAAPALPGELTEDEQYAADGLEPAEEEPLDEVDGMFLFDDEEALPPEEYAPEGYAAEPPAYAAEPELEDYEAEPEPEPEPEWTPEPAPPAEPAEEEVAETAGPSTMWGSPAIDLAWDETTAQWHDPEEPVRPVAPVVAPPVQVRPDSEWDRRLQMALVEETVRSRGAAAAPEWIAAENDPQDPRDDAAFFAEGQWDLGGAAQYDAEPPPDTGARPGAISKLKSRLSPARLLRRRTDRPERATPPPETSAIADGRVEPGFGMPVEEPPLAGRRTTIRSIAIVERQDDLVAAEAPTRALRGLRDDVPPQPPAAPPQRRPSRPEPAVPPPRPSGRSAPAEGEMPEGPAPAPRRPSRPEPAVPPFRPAARSAPVEAELPGRTEPIRPVRPTRAPAPAPVEDAPGERPARPAQKGPLQADEEFAEPVTRPLRPGSGRASPLPTNAPLARNWPQGARPRPALPPPEGEQRSLAPAGNRAVRYLGSDRGEAADEGADDGGEPLFADAMEAPQRRRPPPQRNAPPPGRRVVPEFNPAARRLKIGLAIAAVIVIGWSAYVFVPIVLDNLGGGGTGTETTGGNQGIVLFGGTDPMVFQTGPDNPVNFEGDTAGGVVRVVSSTAGTARATIGPGIAGQVESRQVRIQLDVRGTPGRPATELRLAYLRGSVLLEWRTVTVTGDFAIVDALWTIPMGAATPAGDALLISPGVPGDGTAVDIRRITMDIGG